MFNFISFPNRYQSEMRIPTSCWNSSTKKNVWENSHTDATTSWKPKLINRTEHTESKWRIALPLTERTSVCLWLTIADARLTALCRDSCHRPTVNQPHLWFPRCSNSPMALKFKYNATSFSAMVNAQMMKNATAIRRRTSREVELWVKPKMDCYSQPRPCSYLTPRRFELHRCATTLASDRIGSCGSPLFSAFSSLSCCLWISSSAPPWAAVVPEQKWDKSLHLSGQLLIIFHLQIIEKEPSIIEEYDPYRSWHGSQYGSRYSLHNGNGMNKGYASGGSTIHSNRSLPIDSDHYAIVHSRPGSRHSGVHGRRM